jgi:hypothetical protein
MSPQMFFALTYVPCVIFLGMSIVMGGKIGKIFRNISFVFGGMAMFSYIIFVKNIY